MMKYMFIGVMVCGSVAWAQKPAAPFLSGASEPTLQSRERRTRHENL